MKTKTEQPLPQVILDSKIRNWFDQTGLVGGHLVQHTVLNYATNVISESDYIEKFRTWDKFQQKSANTMLAEIVAVYEIREILGRLG